MPIESAQYINTLQPDWPLGSDPESAGDDHLRMIKQVLQNTFPNIDGQVLSSQTEINDWKYGWAYQAADTTIEMWKARSVAKNDGSLMGIMCQSVSVSEFNANPDLALTFRAIMNILYPVGSVWIDANGNTPDKYLGFGTWEPITGMIAGVGSVPDGHGMSYSLPAGDNHGKGSWRVQDAHIVAETKNLASGATNSTGKHIHNSQYNWAGLKVAEVSGGDVGNDGGTPCVVNTAASFKTTEAADHSHSVTGTISIGSGTATSGTVFVNPYYGLYFWKRTA